VADQLDTIATPPSVGGVQEVALLVQFVMTVIGEAALLSSPTEAVFPRDFSRQGPAEQSVAGRIAVSTTGLGTPARNPGPAATPRSSEAQL
jgi:hypothetical protein